MTTMIIYDYRQLRDPSSGSRSRGGRRLSRCSPPAGCAKDAPQDTWQPAGPNAQEIHNLQWPVFAIAGIVGLIVFAAVGFVVVRFRDKRPGDARADAWQAGARDRPHDHPGADPHRRRHPDRQHR